MEDNACEGQETLATLVLEFFENTIVVVYYLDFHLITILRSLE